MDNFTAVVELYRASSKPAFDGRSFSATVALNDKIKQLIFSLAKSNRAAGYFEDVDIDGEFIDDDELENILNFTSKNISYTFVTPRNSAERFYMCIDDFLCINTLKKGIIPEHFYISSEDFYSLDEKKPSAIIKIEKLCSAIISLSKIAHFHDTKSESSNYRLVFVKNSDAKSVSIALDTCLTPQMLSSASIDDRVLNSFIGHDANTMPHFAEKLGIFRNTIVEYVSDNKLNFENLICNWTDFLKLFENNLSTYMSGFSFHKAREDVASAEADFAEKISKLITDLTNKILSIPVSLLASIGLLKVASTYEMGLILLGILLTSYLLYIVLVNQEKQLNHIIHAKEIAFKPFTANKSSYPAELNNDIAEALSELSKSQKKCRKTIHLFMHLSWLPSSIAIVIFISKTIS
ncbi:hypothetical protein ACOGYQ_000185 [Edwardsiella piscicida]|uniref:hypothetical protein n=1 Tax=Edwardsiella piscicida TaxID=1263550 RepID=UPI000346B457|nr:hypothetical protein [Edwardsiella piscicida]EKS7783467.1 hypothetical protein [Edwardsiella piscicida]UCQ33293.1 hypothetical protein DCF34_09790 [Edwardsiella piscicida]